VTLKLLWFRSCVQKNSACWNTDFSGAKEENATTVYSLMHWQPFNPIYYPWGIFFGKFCEIGDNWVSSILNCSQCCLIVFSLQQTNSVALSPRANYTDWATATCLRNLVLTFLDRGVSCGQRGGSPTVVNFSFLDSFFLQHTEILRTFTALCFVKSNKSVSAALFWSPRLLQKSFM
jgi:hypothetical protein